MEQFIVQRKHTHAKETHFMVAAKYSSVVNEHAETLFQGFDVPDAEGIFTHSLNAVEAGVAKLMTA